MAATTAEAIVSETIPTQMIATSNEQGIQVSPSQALQDNLSESISTTLQSISQQNGVVTAIATVSLPDNSSVSETISTDCISVVSAEGIHAVNEAGITHDQAQTILHTTTGEVMEANTVQGQETVTVSQETLMIPTESVSIVTTNADCNSMQIVSVPGNLPPWAARLHDCELIGDSYRGYVTNEVELDLILTLHKQNTNSCWGTRQSPSSAKPSIRLMWRSQYVPYDGIPFLNTGRRATVMECQFGPRRKGTSNKKPVEYDECGNARKVHRPTCPARIYVKKVRKFPGCHIDPNLEGKNVRQAQERALTALRLAGVETGGEERYYVQLPLPIAHEYHDVDDAQIIPLAPNSIGEVEGQRLNPQVVTKIQELVARGLTGVYTVKHCLKEYVEKELFAGQEAPPRHNKSYFPTIIDMQNHIHQAQVALAEGSLLPLPPLTNIPNATTQTKERTRKRKHTPEKHCQAAQASESFQAAQAVASIQHQASPAVELHQDQQGNGEHPTLTEQVQREMLQQQASEQMGQSTVERQRQVLQHHLQQLHGQEVTTEQDGAGEINIQQQPQILITQNTGRGEGQVVIVVTSNNTFSENQTTLAFSTLQPSQLTSLAQGTFDTDSTPQTLTLIPQHTENSGHTAYLTTQGQTAGSILTVLQPGVSHGADAEVIGVVTDDGQIQTADGTQVQSAGQLLTTQTAVAAVLNTVSIPNTESSQELSTDNIQVAGIHHMTSDGEPFAKREAIGLDLASLVKEAVFESQLSEKVEVPIESPQSVAMEIQPVAMVTEASSASTPIQTSNTTSHENTDLLRTKPEEQSNPMEMQPVTMDTRETITEQFSSSLEQLKPSEDSQATQAKVQNEQQGVNVTVM